MQQQAASDLPHVKSQNVSSRSDRDYLLLNHAVLGAKVIACAGSPEKLEVAKRLGGADHAIDYTKVRLFIPCMTKLIGAGGLGQRSQSADWRERRGLRLRSCWNGRTLTSVYRLEWPDRSHWFCSGQDRKGKPGLSI
jgi:hypothetical protein